MVAWDRTPLGLETAAPCRPRAALAVEGSERRWNLLYRRFRRCTGRLNATQPGVLAVSPLYIRGLGSACKGSVAARQQSAFIRRWNIKLRLTLWFYCGKRAARRLGIRWRAAQNTVF